MNDFDAIFLNMDFDLIWSSMDLILVDLPIDFDSDFEFEELDLYYYEEMFESDEE